MNTNDLATYLSRQLFALGELNSGQPCTRIEFKTGSWKAGTERGAGGFIESALQKYLAEQITTFESLQSSKADPRGRVEQLESCLRGVATCSTCSACRGAAQMVLDGKITKPKASPNVPYPDFCMDYKRCEGLGSCPRKISCVE